MHPVTWIDLVILNYRYDQLIELLMKNEIHPDKYGSMALLMASMNVARSDGSTKQAYLDWAAMMWDSMKDNQSAIQN